MVGKGELKEGYDADVVLVDLQARRTIHNAEQQTKCGWSPWNGETLTGWPIKTWCHGELVYSEGRVDETRRGKEVQFQHS